MSTEENKARVRRLYEEVFNQKNLAAIDDYFAPTVIDHSLPPGAPGGIEGVRQTIAMFLSAFPRRGGQSRSPLDIAWNTSRSVAGYASNGQTIYNAGHLCCSPRWRQVG